MPTAQRDRGNRERHVVLQNLDDQIRDCMQRARECAERANGVVDPKERAEWLMLQARYVKLVRRIAEAKRDREQDEQATRQAGRRSPKCFQSRQMSLNGSSDVAV
jgi:hypothetical protein